MKSERYITLEEIALSIYSAEVEQHITRLKHSGSTGHDIGVTRYLEILRILREDTGHWTYHSNKEGGTSG